MDLWTPIIDESRLHPNFRSIGLQPEYELERKILDEWALGFRDRDGKFVLEFQTTFNSSFWELYIYACLKAVGFIVDFSFPRPDFVVVGPGRPFIVEAAIASNPDGYAPEWEQDLKLPPDLERLLVVASTRLANAIDQKHKKYNEVYFRLQHVKGLPFVLALGPFEQPFFYIQNDQALRRVLYGVDEILHIDDDIAGSRRIVGETRARRVLKPSGAPVNLGLFTDASVKEISAVLFSNTATSGKLRALAENSIPIIFHALRFNANGLKPHRIAEMKPKYSETLLDGLHVCLNPFADIPFDSTVFAGREVAIHSIHRGSGDYLPMVPDNFLIQRMNMGFAFGSEKSAARQPRASEFPAYNTPETTPWEEGVLVPVDGVVGPSDSTQMAHYRGWTIVVFRDVIDDDWGAHANVGLCRTLQSFITVNSQTETMLAANNFHESAATALTEMKSRIDQKAVATETK